MLEKIVIRFVNRMQKENLTEKASRDEYEYVLLILVEQTITVGTILMISIFLNKLMPTVAFIIFFLLLRRRTGGYHADKFWKCYLMTIVTYLGVVRVAAVLSEKPSVMYAVLFLSVLVIVAIGAVNHPNIDMNKDEFQRTKQLSRPLVLMEAMIIITCAVLRRNQLCISYMSLAVILCSVTLCLSKILKQEAEVK